MNYTQTHSVNLPVSDCNKIVKDRLNYNLVGAVKTETSPNVFEYLDVSATAGSIFHSFKPQKMTIKLEPLDDNATNVTIITEPRRPVSDYEYNDWNKELVRLGNTAWQDFFVAARNKLGEQALAVKNVEPFDETENREMRTEQAAATENVSTSAQTTSPEFQTMQSSPSAGVSETSQTQTAKNNSKTLWIIGGIVAAIIVIIIAVSGGFNSRGDVSKFIGTYYRANSTLAYDSPKEEITIEKNRITIGKTKYRDFTVVNDTITVNDANSDIYLKYFSDANCFCLDNNIAKIKITNTKLLSIAQKRNGNFDYQEYDYDSDFSVRAMESFSYDGSYFSMNQKTNEYYRGSYKYTNGLLRVYDTNSMRTRTWYFSNDGYIYMFVYTKTTTN